MSKNTDAPDIDAPFSQPRFEEHTAQVRQIALGLAKELPRSVQINDLIQDGMLGLLDALLRASKEMTARHFRNFAAKRIRGAVLDGLRATDWGTRRVRRTMRRIEIATQKLGHQLGRAPTEGEVAEALDMPLAAYQQTLQEAHGYLLISLDDLEDRGENGNYLTQCALNNADPLVVLERSAFQAALAAALNGLPAQEREVLELYYEEGRNMREIAGNLSLSEGRISQLHTQAIARLRAALFTVEEQSRLLTPRRKPR